MSSAPSRWKPLRVWPGVVAVILLLLARFGLKAVIPGFRGFSTAMMWSFGAAGVVLLWWLLLSRARWFERLGALVLMLVAVAALWQIRHESLGPLWLLAYVLPGLCLGLVAGAAAGRRLPERPRIATIAACILLASGAWAVFRTEGISGDHDARFSWRWAKSPEERLLAQAAPEPVATAPASPAGTAQPPPAGDPAVTIPPPRVKPASPEAAPEAAAADWPAFRGPARDGIVRGIRIKTDWSSSPPVEMWRHPVGPGWSSFAVRGGRIYTQEQRGEHEVVACYDRATGKPVWTHRDAVRFFESNAGAGPRGTPTLSNGRVYAFGATGILNALDTGSGQVVWSRDAASDSDGTESMSGGKTKIPDWGFSSSPLVVNDLVIVAVAGQLVAYDAGTGQPRWFGPAGGVSYSSPHLVAIDAVPQIVLMSAAGAIGVAPADGRRLWEHPWRGFPIVQPALMPGGDILIAAGGDGGIRRVAISNASGGWTAERRWGSAGLKPYFNDFVVHNGHAYGFDGRILACIDLNDGARKWKGGRYGNGQLLLLADQDVLLVLSEEGELALVKASPDQFTEIARFKAIEGKTWNHPALTGDVLLVRNAEEMAAFRLPRDVR